MSIYSTSAHNLIKTDCTSRHQWSYGAQLTCIGRIAAIYSSSLPLDAAPDPDAAAVSSCCGRRDSACLYRHAAGKPQQADSKVLRKLTTHLKNVHDPHSGRSSQVTQSRTPLLPGATLFHALGSRTEQVKIMLKACLFYLWIFTMSSAICLTLLSSSACCASPGKATLEARSLLEGCDDCSTDRKCCAWRCRLHRFSKTVLLVFSVQHDQSISLPVMLYCNPGVKQAVATHRRSPHTKQLMLRKSALSL